MKEAETRAEHIDPAHAGATVFMSTHLLNIGIIDGGMSSGGQQILSGKMWFTDSSA